MRLKTKLVLAITTLVFVISGVLSLVFVYQLVESAVRQSYKTNRMVADQVQLAVRNALVTGLQDRKVDPNNPDELRSLAADAVRDSSALRVVVDSVNRYSETVYDLNIADNQGITLLSTNHDNEGKPLPVRPNYEELLHAGPLKLIRQYRQAHVYEVVAPLDRNGVPFISIHVGVRTTLLAESYKPGLVEAGTLMAFVLGAALLVAFLLSNLALRPLERISQQLDLLTGASEPAPAEKQRSIDMASSVSHKIERFGQRMKNVEEVFSALKENLDQILGNLQDGIFLFTGDGRTVLVSEAAGRAITSSITSRRSCSCRRNSTGRLKSTSS